jgi:hypothetical protein
MSTTQTQFAGRSLFGHTRSALLAMLYGHADQSFYVRQLVRAVGAGHGALQRELKYMTEMGLVLRKTQGNQVLYQANSQSPIFSEIKGLIMKTVGIHDVICTALVSLEPKIQIAFVYGSMARQKERANSDVDLMVLGDASFSEVVRSSTEGARQGDQPDRFPSVRIPIKIGSREPLLAQCNEREETLRVGDRE